MLQVAEVKVEQQAGDWMMRMCNDLFKSWQNDLTAEEKEVWLWNASVELLRIKQRRSL